MSSRCSFLFCIVIAMMTAPHHAQADNGCYSTQCTNQYGSHYWTCGGNGLCTVSDCACGSCQAGQTACGFSCCTGGQECHTSEPNQPWFARCECPAGKTFCNGNCVDLQNDPQHCGSCARTCSAPSNGTALCSNGTCLSNCNTGYTKCGNNCFNLQTDAENCGRCDNECDDAPNAAKDICTAGHCGFQCDWNTTQCGNSCTELSLDPDNCGSCGNKCSSSQTCAGGACVGQQGCQPGSFNDGTGQCELCPAGSFSAGGNATGCTPCPAGTYAASAGNASCTPARPGSSVATAGSSLPTRCPAGTFSQSPSSTSCTPCPDGTTSPPGGRSCEAGVVLCKDINFGGVCELFTVDHRDLAATKVGDGTASSIIVPSAVIASLFSQTNFNNCPGPSCNPPGSECKTFGSTNPDLHNSFIGNDNASSIQVGSPCPCTSPTQACNPGVGP